MGSTSFLSSSSATEKFSSLKEASMRDNFTLAQLNCAAAEAALDNVDALLKALKRLTGKDYVPVDQKRKSEVKKKSK